MGQKLLENSKMGLTEYPTELLDHLLVEVLTPDIKGCLHIVDAKIV